MQHSEDLWRYHDDVYHNVLWNWSEFCRHFGRTHLKYYSRKKETSLCGSLHSFPRPKTANLYFLMTFEIMAAVSIVIQVTEKTFKQVSAKNGFVLCSVCPALDALTSIGPLMYTIYKLAKSPLNVFIASVGKGLVIADPTFRFSDQLSSSLTMGLIEVTGSTQLPNFGQVRENKS